jgi:hypothetical protein
MAVELPKFTRAKTVLLLESSAKGRVCVVTGRQRNLGDIHRTHAQFSSGTLQPHPPDVAGDILTKLGRENAMKMGYRKARNISERFPGERFIDMLVDVPFYTVNPFAVVLSPFFIYYHYRII